MYGTMDVQQPLLPLTTGRPSSGSNQSAPPALNHNRRDGTRLARAQSVRSGPVLASILEKPHQQSNRNVVVLNNLELDGVITSTTSAEGAAQPLPKSFVYTMLNPRSDAWQAVFFKWFITCVIIAVREDSLHVVQLCSQLQTTTYDGYRTFFSFH